MVAYREISYARVWCGNYVTGSQHREKSILYSILRSTIPMLVLLIEGANSGFIHSFFLRVWRVFCVRKIHVKTDVELRKPARHTILSNNPGNELKI